MSNEAETRERNYGIDALRILSMLFVVMVHVINSGGIAKSVPTFSASYMVIWYVEGMASCCVNCFGLISGYNRGGDRRYRYSSILYLWLQAFSCFAFCTVGYWLLYPSRVSKQELLHIFFPVLHGNYWYYSCYFFISLFIPVMDYLLRTLPRNKLRLNLMLITMASITAYLFADRDVFMLDEGYSAIWLAVLYMLGGYLRLYGKEDKIWKFFCRHGLILFLLAPLTIVAFRSAVDFAAGLGMNRPKNLWNDYTSPPVIVSAMALLALFSKWKPGKRMCRTIAFLAPSAFSVYLLHNHDLISRYHFHGGFVQYAELEAYILPFAVAGISIMIYVLCTIVDLIRRQCFWILGIKKHCRRLDGMIDRWIEQI